MKVLWFTNISCSAANKIGQNEVSGGWLTSLETELTLRDDIFLSICFYTYSEFEPFTINKTTFYPIFRNDASSRIKRLLGRLYDQDMNDSEEVYQLLGVIEKVNPDIIHIHGTEENFGLISQYTKIPILISLQGILAPCSEKLFSGIPISAAIRYEKFSSKILLNTAHTKVQNMKRWAFREEKILEHAKYVMGRTDWDRRISRILAPNSMYFTVNEVLRDAFYKCTWQHTTFDKKILIVTTSGTDFHKGFETIVKTATLLSSIQDFDFEWIVIGVDKRSEIVSIVCKWLKADLEKINITLLGQKKETDVLQILSNASIYCQVSHIENSSNSLCEAMLVGKPIVATFAGGTSSLLENMKEGLLVQEGDFYSIAGAIKEFVTNHVLANECAKNARLKAIKRHDKKKIVNDLVTVYNRILNLS
jgi:glycosyltransferase involved in cell wall biosynthesis